MIKKISIVYIIFITLFIFFFNIKAYAMDDIIEKGDNFLQKGNAVEEVIEIKNLGNVSDFFYRVFLAVGIVVAIIVGLIIGIKYIYEGAEGQAKLKEAFVPYIVGCFIVFSAFPIWKMVINFGNDFGGFEEGEGIYKTAYEKILSSIKGIEADIITDGDFEKAWHYICNTLCPGKSNASLFWEYKNGDSYAYIYLEYLSRCTTNEIIIEEFENLIKYLKTNKGLKVTSTSHPTTKVAKVKVLSDAFYVKRFCDMYLEAYGEKLGY